MANSGGIVTTTTTTTTTSTQSGTQMVVGSQANTVTVGNFVTDVTLQPYIAPQIISFFAYNLRPNCRVHVFFDSVLVDEYCAPADIPTSIADTSDYQSIKKNGAWGQALTTNSLGTLAGQFNIPGGKFKVGDRILEIADVDDLARGNDAITTQASAGFTASNLSVTKQMVTLTTVNPVISYIPVTNTVVSTNTTTNTIVIQNKTIINVTVGYEPIAQGLTINTPNQEAGIYATSLVLYFKQLAKVSDHGCAIYLCETENGYPKGDRILPFSGVHLNRDDIMTSDDASIATFFTFESPVFLASNTEYAFVVKPDNNDPDYRVYSAKLGDLDITTGYQVFSQPAIGTAFYGATHMQWTALQNEYIKFNLNAAYFTQPTGNALFQNSNNDYMTVQSLTFANSSAAILPGDYIFKSTANTVGSVQVGTKGVIRYYDAVTGKLYIVQSTGGFDTASFVQVHRFANTAASASPNSATLVAVGTNLDLQDIVVDAMVAQFATAIPAGTGLEFSYRGVSNTYMPDSTDNELHSGYESEFFDQERLVVSRSTEMVSSLSGARSLNIRADMSTDTPLLSPMIDMVKKNPLVIENIMSNTAFDYTEFFDNGKSLSKYISQVVTLAPGQDAEDVQMILTLHRPVGTDARVYMRFLNSEDPDSIIHKTWTPLINKNEALYTSTNPNDFREFVYTIPGGYGTIPLTGGITCANSGANVDGFGTSFTTDLAPGWSLATYANSTFADQTRRIVSIANNTRLTLESPFNGNYSNAGYCLAVPPTTAWQSTASVRQVNGTVTTSSSNTWVIGSGTGFLTDFAPGSIIAVGGDEQVVISIANNEALQVGTPWMFDHVGGNVFYMSASGLSYLNANSNLYTTYIQFQVKVCLLSEDSCKAPIMDNLRVLALS